MNTGVLYVHAVYAEIAADRREQIGLIMRVNHHLDACAMFDGTRFDERFSGLRTGVKMTSMPGNFDSVMAQKISHIQLLPKMLACLRRQPEQSRQINDLLLASGQHGAGVGRRAAA